MTAKEGRQRRILHELQLLAVYSVSLWFSPNYIIFVIRTQQRNKSYLVTFSASCPFQVFLDIGIPTQTGENQRDTLYSIAIVCVVTLYGLTEGVKSQQTLQQFQKKKNRKRWLLLLQQENMKSENLFMYIYFEYRNEHFSLSRNYKGSCPVLCIV